MTTNSEVTTFGGGTTTTTASGTTPSPTTATDDPTSTTTTAALTTTTTASPPVDPQEVFLACPFRPSPLRGLPGESPPYFVPLLSRWNNHMFVHGFTTELTGSGSEGDPVEYSTPASQAGRGVNQGAISALAIDRPLLPGADVTGLIIDQVEVADRERFRATDGVSEFWDYAASANFRFAVVARGREFMIGVDDIVDGAQPLDQRRVLYRTDQTFDAVSLARGDGLLGRDWLVVDETTGIFSVELPEVGVGQPEPAPGDVGILTSRLLISKPGLKTAVITSGEGLGNDDTVIYASDGTNIFAYSHNYQPDPVLGDVDEWSETTIFSLPPSELPTLHGQGVIKKMTAFGAYKCLAVLIEQEAGTYSPDGGVTVETKASGHQKVAVLNLATNSLVRFGESSTFGSNTFFCGMTFAPLFDLTNQTRSDLYDGGYVNAAGSLNSPPFLIILNGEVKAFATDVVYEGEACTQAKLFEYASLEQADASEVRLANGLEVVEPFIYYSNVDTTFVQFCDNSRNVANLELPNFIYGVPAELVSLSNIPELPLQNIDDTRERGRITYVQPGISNSEIYAEVPDTDYALNNWESLFPADTSLGQPDVDDSSKPIDVALDRSGRVAALAYENGQLYYASIPGFAATDVLITIEGVLSTAPGADVIRSICMVPDANVFPEVLPPLTTTTTGSPPPTSAPLSGGELCIYPSPFDASGDANIMGSPSFFMQQRLQYSTSGNNSLRVDQAYWKDNPSGTEKYVILGMLEAKYDYPNPPPTPAATPQHSLNLRIIDQTFGQDSSKLGLVNQIFGEFDDGSVLPTNRLTPGPNTIQQHVMEIVDMPFGADLELGLDLSGSASRHSSFISSLGIAAFYVGDLTELTDYVLVEEQTHLVDAVGAAYQTEVHQIVPGLTNSQDWTSFVRLRVEIDPSATIINEANPNSFNVDLEFAVQLWNTDTDTLAVEHPLKIKGYFEHSPTLSFLHVLSTNDLAGNVSDGHLANYEIRILSTRNTALGTPTLKTLVFSIRTAAIGCEVYRDDLAEDSFDFNAIPVTIPPAGVCPMGVIIGSRQAEVNGVSLSFNPNQEGWANFTQHPFFNEGLPSNGNTIRGVAPLLDMYARGFIPGDPSYLNFRGVYHDSAIGGNFGVVFHPATSGTTPAPTTTAAPTTPAPTTAGPTWDHGWVYAACADGIRSFTNTQQAFLAHAGGTVGVCAADGPSIYFTATAGEVYYANPELTAKVLVYKDETLTEMGDIAYDASQDRLIVHAKRGAIEVIFKLQRNGTFDGVIADVGSGLNRVVGRMEVHPTAPILYLAGEFSQTPEFFPNAGPATLFPSYRYPALMDTTRVVGNQDYYLKRQGQYLADECQVLPRSFGFSGRGLLNQDTTPVLTTTTTPAPTTTTTTTEATTTPEPTTGTGTSTTPSPTLPTTTAAPTTLSPTTPNPGEVPCWNSSPGVQAFPDNSMIRITQSATDVEQIDQLITGLAPGLELVFTVEFSAVVDKTRIFIANEASTILGVQVVLSPGVWKTTATVPESGTVRVGVRVEAGAFGTYSQVDNTSLKSCNVGFAPQEVATGKWQGYLTTGELTSANLEQGLTACFQGENLPDLPVEPGRIFSAAGLSRKTIEVWSQDRTRWTGDPDCLSNIEPSERGYIQQYVGQPDDFRLSGGHQATVRQEGAQTLVFGAFAGGGELGPPPGEIPLFPGEVPLDDRTYLDNGLGCNEVVRSINGVGGPHMEFRSDRGVLIEPHPELHRAVIHVNGEGINFCPDFAAPEQVECLPPRTDFCGSRDLNDDACPGEPDLRGGYVAGGQVLSLPVARAASVLAGTSDYGTCDYRRELSGWSLLHANPAFNCECQPPKVYGHPGQEVRLAAAPIAADPFFFVRNAYFAEGLAHWHGEELTWDAGSEAFLDGLPHAVSQETLLQPMIPIAAGKYRLQARFQIQGLVMYALKRQSNGEVFLSGILGENDRDLVTDFANIPATELLLSFHVSGSLRITEVGLVKWA